MNIVNSTSTVNSTVKNLLYSYIPLGSDYMIICDSDYSYVMYLRRIGQDYFTRYDVDRVSSGSSTYGTTYYYTVSHDDTHLEYDELTCSYPYYSYSNISGQGIRETLPVVNDTCAILLLVIASMMVLRFVFGGIKLWKSRLRSY